MITCSQCRFWNRLSECSLVDVVEEGTRLRSEDEKIALIEYRVADDYDLDIKFRTSAKFGCVLGERK